MERARQARLRAVRSWLRAWGLDGLLVTSPHNRFYLSGFLAEDMGMEESAGALLVTRHQQMVLTDPRYREQALEEAPGWEVVIYRGMAHEMGRIGKEIGLRRMAYEPRFLSCFTKAELDKALPRTVWFDARGFLEGKRRSKEFVEVEAIRGAIEVAEEVLEEVEQRVAPGMTERELAAWIVQAIAARSQGPSFQPIVASGPNAALPHAVPTDRPLAEGEPVIIDMGARLHGYCSDMTRTFFPGRVSQRWKEIYETVWRAQRAGVAACGPGVPCREVDRAAREVIKRAGLGEAFVHATGHGVGIAVHEEPPLSPRSRQCLRPGDVVTVEPGIYLPGQGGVRLEAMVLITADGAVELTGQGGYLRW